MKLLKSIKLVLLMLVGLFMSTKSEASCNWKEKDIYFGTWDSCSIKTKNYTLLFGYTYLKTTGCYKYKWLVNGSIVSTGSNPRMLTYKVSQNGTYTIKLILIDTCNNCDTSLTTTRTISCIPTTGCDWSKAGIYFTNNCKDYIFEMGSNIDDKCISYTTLRYDFKTGKTDTIGKTRVFKYTFPDTGLYKIKTILTNKCLNCATYFFKEIRVTCNTDPCKNFNPTLGYRIDGNIVIFEAQSGTHYTYTWVINGKSYESKDRIIKVDFGKPGSYKGCVTITDASTKCTKTICKEFTIHPKNTDNPCKDFNPTIGFKQDGGKVNFTVDGGKGSTFEWSFGDGKYSTDRTPTHIYSIRKLYNMCNGI